MTACHRLPERSIFWKGKPLLCYRCAAINLSFFLLLIIHFFEKIFHFYTLDILILDIVANNLFLAFIFVILLQIPMILDGGIQAMTQKYESTNFLRTITGSLSGIGQFYFFFFIGRTIGLLLDI